MKIISFFENLGNFFANGWQGLIAGLIVGIVFLILMKIFVFKNKGVGNIIALLIILPCMIGGMFISNAFSDNNSNSIKVQTIAGTTIADPTKYLTITANGGFDKSYIELAEADPNCPVAEDKNFKINMVEYKDSVIIYYLNAEDNIVYNSIFDKTDNGLTFTGCFDVMIKDSFVRRGTWFPVYEKVFINKMNDIVNYAPLANSVTKENGRKYINLFGANKEKIPSYYSITHEPTSYAIRNMAPIQMPMWQSSKDIEEDMQCAQLGCYDIYNDYFQQLNDFGIKCTEETVFSDMNSFYNVVYKSTSENENDTLVTVTDLVGDVKDGIVYKSNRFVNVNYLDISDTNAFTGKINEDAKKYIEVDPTDDTLTAISNPMVEIRLWNSELANFENFSASDTPVIINLKNRDTGLSYNYTYDTYGKLDLGITRALPFGIYDYTILSTTLDFNGTTGDLIIDKDNTSYIFNYSYTGNYLNASIKLNPIDNVDLYSFNIADNPVTITLTNKDDTSIFYTYVFNNQASFDNGITKNMLIGSYTYTINSNALSFAEITGEFDFDINSTNIAFNYDYKVQYDSLTVVSNQNYSSQRIYYEDAIYCTDPNNYHNKIAITDKTTNQTSYMFAGGSFSSEINLNSDHKYAIQVYGEINGEKIVSQLINVTLFNSGDGYYYISIHVDII